MLYMKLDKYDVQRIFREMDRDYFSLPACEAFVEMGEELGVDVEFDPIGFCCDFQEFPKSDYHCLIQDYDNICDMSYQDWLAENEETDTQENREEYVNKVMMESLSDHTLVWELPDGILIQNF